MKTCAYCETKILFGGEGQGELRYCNSECQRHGAIVEAASRIPEQLVSLQALQIHSGRCPECNGPGPVDVHTSHRVWSLLLITSWSSNSSLSCRPCGVKSILGSLAFSAAAGWWGVPWGLLVTPIQIGRNVFAMMRGPNPKSPSPALSRRVRMGLAGSLVGGRPNGND